MHVRDPGAVVERGRGGYNDRRTDGDGAVADAIIVEDSSVYGEARNEQGLTFAAVQGCLVNPPPPTPII